MKILFINRSSVFSVPGGDTIQMLETAKELELLGVQVDFYNKLKTVDYAQYDLLHCFNITRPADILAHLNKTNKPFVLSPIFVDYSFYKELSPMSKMGILTSMFGTDGIEYIKTFAKHFLGKEKISFTKYFWMGQKRSIQTIMSKASYLLPNSKSENKRLQTRYNTNVPYQVVVNGVDTEKFKFIESRKRIKKQVLCVALIEPRKNQYNLIKALTNTDYKLKIIGDPAPNHSAYFKKCRAIAGDNVSFISRIPQSELVKHYLESEIHILPSWFETTGLSSLEAALLGCKIIVSPNGDTQDYFKNYVVYCKPDSIDSIKDAIEESHSKEYNSDLKDLASKNYLWRKTAEKTLEIYSKTINKGS